MSSEGICLNQKITLKLVAVVGIARTDRGFGCRFFSIQTDSVLAAKARELCSMAEQSEKWDG